MLTPFRTLAALALCPVLVAAAQGPPVGQRVFICGHSFHVMMAAPLGQIAEAAGIEGHVQVGTLILGGSSVDQHWETPEDRSEVKAAIARGKVDVLTVSPNGRLIPDPGIEKFADLLVANNPEGRVLVQASWPAMDGHLNRELQERRPRQGRSATDSQARRADQPQAGPERGGLEREIPGEAGPASRLPGAGRRSRVRPPRARRRRQGARHRQAIGAVQGRSRPSSRAHRGAGRLLSLRGDLPAQPGGPARAGSVEKGRVGTGHRGAQPRPARGRLGDGDEGTAQRRPAEAPTK